MKLSLFAAVLVASFPALATNVPPPKPPAPSQKQEQEQWQEQQQQQLQVQKQQAEAKAQADAKAKAEANATGGNASSVSAGGAGGGGGLGGNSRAETGPIKVTTNSYNFALPSAVLGVNGGCSTPASSITGGTSGASNGAFIAAQLAFPFGGGDCQRRQELASQRDLYVQLKTAGLPVNPAAFPLLIPYLLPIPVISPVLAAPLPVGASVEVGPAPAIKVDPSTGKPIRGLW